MTACSCNLMSETSDLHNKFSDCRRRCSSVVALHADLFLVEHALALKSPADHIAIIAGGGVL